MYTKTILTCIDKRYLPVILRTFSTDVQRGMATEDGTVEHKYV